MREGELSNFPKEVIETAQQFSLNNGSIFYNRKLLKSPVIVKLINYDIMYGVIAT